MAFHCGLQAQGCVVGPFGRLPGPGLAGQMDSKQLVIKWVNEQ